MPKEEFFARSSLTPERNTGNGDLRRWSPPTLHAIDLEQPSKKHPRRPFNDRLPPGDPITHMALTNFQNLAQLSLVEAHAHAQLLDMSPSYSGTFIP
jgi:hypothetical protein